MRCEVVAIGTELLLGQIVDTNSSWIGEQLALAGIDSHFQIKVGDNFTRMEAALRQALERSDAVICCGGLGPTQDDITREVIASIMGVEMRRDETIVEKIRVMFESRGRVMADNNRRQADVPLGATVIPQMPGTAPGLICPVDDKVIYALPGVPYELHEMMQQTVLPDLRRRSGQTAVIRSRILRTWGHSESGLAELLATRIEELDGLGNPTLAFQASGIEGIKVRITVKAEDEAAAQEILSTEEAGLREMLGEIVFGVDGQSMEHVVIDLLRTRGQSFAVAESLTGGLMALRLTEIDPTMEVFRGASVAPAEDPEAAAEDRALAAARGVREAFGSDFGLAALQVDGGDDGPSKTVALAIASAAAERSTSVALPGDRRRLRSFAVISLLNYLRLTLSGS